MQRRKNNQADRLVARRPIARRRNLRGFVVHWRDPSDASDTIQFHPEFLPFQMASEMARALSVAGLPAVVSPMICKNYGSKIPGIQRLSATTVELKIVDFSDSET